MLNKIKVGISQGDTNGIGLEVIIKTFREPEMLDLCIPVIFSSQKTVSYHRKAIGVEDFNYSVIKKMNEINSKKIYVFNCYDEEVAIELGKPTPSGGNYALKSLTMACDALEKNEIDVLVTAPINKKNIYSDQFPYAGHTEYLENRFGKNKGLMIMVSDKMKLALVTTHIPLSAVSGALSIDKIYNKLETFKTTLIQDFNIRKPKIAVLSLNPHSGDNGLMGTEEEKVIIPVIKKANENNTLAFGPFSSDGFFGSYAHQQFDGVLAMYHDQGLIPFKMLSFYNGVNYTAGLNVIRTSPDHGTAYEISGKNLASEESFRNAVYAAIDIYKTRQQFKEFSKNPLKSNPITREK